jgi:predicted transcriptional regulator
VKEAVTAIKAAGKPLDAAALAMALNCDQAAARNRLQRGVSRGVLTRVKRGFYDVAA